MTIVDEGNLKNYLERQKVRNLRSSLRKQPTFRNATAGFLRLVRGRGGGGEGEQRLPTIKHFSVSLSFLKSKGEGKPLSIPRSFPRVIRRTSQVCWKYRENLQEIRNASPGQQQRISHCPFDMYDTIIHCKIYRGGMVWCVPSHKSFRLCC